MPNRFLEKLAYWFDTASRSEDLEQDSINVTDWFRIIPFMLMHLMCLGVFWVGWSWELLTVAFVLYAIRMFAITGFYHRYFSHRTFETSRPVQFFFAALGASSVQRGPLWWAAHHRKHHRHSDTEKDVHSPHHHGFWWSHVGWITSPSNFPTDYSQVPDLTKYPELRFIDRFDTIIPFLLAFILFLIGGFPYLIWGFFVSSVVLFHITCSINSLSHLWGTQRYKTSDQSRNNLILALLTFGEGWHNNHHKYPGASRQGFFWWEIDLTYYGLKLLSLLGVIRDLRPVPQRVLQNH
jgi:stearoyl-CoA desaturase (delta-9 desaturase)|tara:strand:- start:969 stop:1850 length:882 start_codon:yes stop_codon:yes gene_type:complete